MKFLLDQSVTRIDRAQAMHPELIGGQLLTPLTAFGVIADGPFAIDNGAYSQMDMSGFTRIVEREQANKGRCLFVALPDVVGSALRTLEAFEMIWPRFQTWPIALVCQDGQESLPIPWKRLSSVFIGGTTHWKMSDHVKHIIKTAQILGVHTHVGRVNTPDRFMHFHDMGVDTCDGSGASRYDWMLDAISARLQSPRAPLLSQLDAEAISDAIQSDHDSTLAAMRGDA